MIRRRLGLGAAVIALTVPLAGCVTVHGERALIPALRPGEAGRVLANFAAYNNKATKSFDQQAVTSIEAGPLGAIDEAGVRAKHTDNPQGNQAYSPLVFSGRRFFIPEQRGWPKFFVAEAATNRNGDQRWLLAFRRGGPTEPWKADFLGVAAPDALPDFALDQDGHAEQVPLTGTDLLVQPGRLSARYTDYLDAGRNGGKDGGLFADGPSTSGLKDSRTQHETATTVVQYADQPDTAGDFTPVALRTKDGGAVVFFGSRHQSRSTFRPGHRLNLDKDIQALTTGTPKTSITLSYVAQNMAAIPPRSTSGSAAKVAFISRLEGLVAARGA